MSKKKKKKENIDQKPKVSKDLEGFDIRIDSFGEIKSTVDIDKLNTFLNRNVDDKKLREREDLERLKKDQNPDDDE